MVARGRKQKVCLLKRNLEETLETHLAGKATEKRQNFDPCIEHVTLHFTLNGEIRRAPGPLPVNSTQTAWEDTEHKVN
jgi:hypothetical protein